MDIDKVLIDLSIIGQLKQHDKLGVRNLPGRQPTLEGSGFRDLTDGIMVLTDLM